jgi:hypothetical protein
MKGHQTMKGQLKGCGPRKKNMAKYESYKLAFQLIDESIRHNFPLQAITIEESILTDRLSSTLNAGKKNAKPCDTLGQALILWRGIPQRNISPSNNAVLFDDAMMALLPRIEVWWKERNALLHGIAKSRCGEGPEISAEAFMARAVNAATEGLDLTKIVKAWTQHQVRHALNAR